MSSETPPPVGPPTPQPPTGYTAEPPMSPSDQRLWAMLVHLGGIIIGVVSPLIGYLVMKDRGEFVREHTKTALNFQLTMLLGYVIGFILTFVLIGIFVYMAVWIATLVFSIIAAITANKGEPYTYPSWVAIKFIK